jgi:hypothetical protein
MNHHPGAHHEMGQPSWPGGAISQKSGTFGTPVVEMKNWLFRCLIHCSLGEFGVELLKSAVPLLNLLFTWLICC